ncbi:MAG: PadR family transcriptional regulator [Candidatus Thorarchaeota archaeon]
MRESREWIRNRILLVLDNGPCHGYDILRSLNEHVSNLRLTTLYRWLHTMEAEGLVESIVQPGPHGPDRRVYRLGARGENQLREMLKDSIEVIMHFYDAYRHSITGSMHQKLDEEVKVPKGRVLFAAVPRVREIDINTVQYLMDGNGSQTLDVLGDSTILTTMGIRHKILKGDLVDIPSPNERYAQIWVSGIPNRDELHGSVAEFKRVLIDGGIVRILAPFVYFDRPEQPDLGEFLRVTAIQLFPELGMANGDDVGTVLEAVFPDCGALDLFPGLVIFWARKTAIA